MKFSYGSINHFGYAAIGLLSLFLLTSCSTKEEGAIDYRKAQIGEPTLKELGDVTNNQGEPIRVAKLLRKNVLQDNPDALFKDKDKITIRLTSAYINDFTEGPFSWINDLVVEGEVIPRGEIAVVVNDFPFEKR